MSIITKMLKQSALYWGPPQEDGDGSFIWPPPVALACRWESVAGAAKDPKSHEEINNSVVYVSEDVEVNGFLLLVTDEDYEGPSGNYWVGGYWYGSAPPTYVQLSESELAGMTPNEIPQARKIVGFQKLPDLRAKRYLRIATV